MPWWKSSPSSSSASSPSAKQSPTSSAGASPSKRNRKESAFLWSKRGESPQYAQPRYSRQRKPRPFADAGNTTLETVSSNPVSRSPSSLDCVPTRSSSSPVLHPHPLPLPGHHQNNEACAVSGKCADSRLPSPKGAAAAVSAVEMEEGSGGMDCTAAAVAAEVNVERVSAPAGRYGVSIVYSEA